MHISIFCNKSHAALCATLLFSVLAAPPLAAETNCSACNTTIEMTHEEWRCLAQGIDRYLQLSSDPVFIPVVPCDAAAGKKSDTRSGDPIVRIPGDAISGVEAKNPLILSKQQLRCVADNLDDILRNEEPVTTIDLTATCTS